MKQKTHKALSKRIKVTSTGKALKRTAGQDHYNASESGNTTRNKRMDKPFTKRQTRAMQTLLPYASIK